MFHEHFCRVTVVKFRGLVDITVLLCRGFPGLNSEAIQTRNSVAASIQHIFVRALRGSL